ncbi:uncharacterized protein LOC129759582 [Uranotaenia lowii]|uniref:uncharacterized protein LOC129759582 n=1 Tax=Uranotaenia lowii TaxID=190385 RepID=UPI0024783C59|nr:uncharacterized protein LOC129759582 [Uranotaenia lowii]
MTLAEIVKEGRSLETIDKVRQQLQRSEINKVTSTKNECFRCGRLGHFANSKDCPALEEKCKKCGLIGHYKNCCKTKTRSSREKSRRVRSIQKDEAVGGEEDEYDEKFVFAAGSDEVGGENVVCCVGGVKMKWIVDSGAAVNVIDSETWNYLKKQKEKVISQNKESRKTLKAYGNNRLHVLGEFETRIATNYNEVVAEVFLVEEKGASLLSRKTATDLQILSINTDVWNVTAKGNKIGRIIGSGV